MGFISGSIAAFIAIVDGERSVREGEFRRRRGMRRVFRQQPAGGVTIEFHRLRGRMDDEYAGAAGQ
jgi:hypothetical protein